MTATRSVRSLPCPWTPSSWGGAASGPSPAASPASGAQTLLRDQRPTRPDAGLKRRPSRGTRGPSQCVSGATAGGTG
eukprot:1523901-Lingulodinium_polyedra.AAC.1